MVAGVVRLRRGNGRGAVGRAVAVRLLADRAGLTAGLSAALARRSFRPGHDRGRVWVDVATMLTAGGESIADIDTLRQQAEVLGPVASPPTVWRVLDETTAAALNRVEKARARVRRHVWELLPIVPASKVAGTDLGEVVGLDADATLVTAHSEKEQAKATFKGGYGFHPLGVWCDNTHELLAVMLRPGNAGSNHAGDHIEVLTRAIAQLPAAYRLHLLVRADGAGATHELVDCKASVCGTVSPVRRTTSLMSTNSCFPRSRTICSASSRPMPCTSVSPSRTTKLQSRRCSRVRSGADRKTGTTSMHAL